MLNNIHILTPHSVIERIMLSINVNNKNDCWHWNGHKDKDGYGVTSYRYQGKRYWLRIPRVIYEINIGEIPDNLHVLHICDNPSCANPKHLYAGTPLDNARDRDNRGRHGFTKLTKEKVRAIRSLYKDKTHNQFKLGEIFGVCQTQISRVIKYQAWSSA